MTKFASEGMKRLPSAVSCSVSQRRVSLMRRLVRETRSASARLARPAASTAEFVLLKDAYRASASTLLFAATA
jgi:hypothetical protein